METKFQTSFIPKRPLPPAGVPMNQPGKHRRTTSMFMGLAVLLFSLSVTSLVGMYAWRSILLRTQDAYKQNLADRQKQFNVDLIEQLKQSNVKIDLAQRLLTNHIAFSNIFHYISLMTAENIRFSNLSVDVGASQKDGIKITMNGQGASLSAVAFQSDVLNHLEQYGLRKIIKNPILSDPVLNADGSVSFGFSAMVDPGSLSYEKSVIGSDASASSTSAGQ